jgi:hypothetical protein
VVDGIAVPLTFDTLIGIAASLPHAGYRQFVDQSA